MTAGLRLTANRLPVESPPVESPPANDRSHRASEIHDAILTRLSHELRTPLNSVIGFSRVLHGNRKGNQHPADLAMLQAIQANGERLLGLVEDLMALSVQPPVVEVPMPTPVCVANIAAEVVGKWQSAAERKGILLTLEVDARGSIAIDPTSLTTLLTKLVCNAVKFTDKGRVVVTVTSRDGCDEPGSIIIADSGIGIAADRLLEVFEPFAQVEDSLSRHYDGAGLGLPIARTMASAIGCTLDVRSAPGSGTRIGIEFPE
jgi:signal transduction histidine kinase